MSYHQTIYNRLRQGGLTEAAALGMLGNWECESGCEPYRLQGDYSAYRTASKYYTSKVQTGVMSRREFGTDEKGYGLAQWTYVNKEKTAGRKYDLFDFWLQTGGAIDDVIMQVDFALYELHHGYSHVWAEIKNCTDLRTATDIICRKYEQPYQNNVDARFAAAKEIMEQIDLNNWKNDADQTEPSEPATDDEGMPIQETWPPRTIDFHCSAWPEVWLLQGLLKSHGYNVTSDGMWTNELTLKLQSFQKSEGLDADGVCGKNTWIKLGLNPAIFERR